MAKVEKGNARKYDLFSKIDNLIKDYNSSVCIYNVGNVSCADMITIKKKLNDVKISVMPNKLSRIVLSKYFPNFKDTIKGKICLVFSKDIFIASAVNNSLKKALRNHLNLVGVAWLGNMNCDKNFVNHVSTFGNEKGFYSAIVGKVAEPVLKFKALLKMQGENA